MQQAPIAADAFVRSSLRFRLAVSQPERVTALIIHNATPSFCNLVQNFKTRAGLRFCRRKRREDAFLVCDTQRFASTSSGHHGRAVDRRCQGHGLKNQLEATANTRVGLRSHHERRCPLSADVGRLDGKSLSIDRPAICANYLQKQELNIRAVKLSRTQASDSRGFLQISHQY